MMRNHGEKLKFGRHETESFLFYLHYRVTFLILMGFFSIRTFNLVADDAIVCTENLGMPPEFISWYCWHHSTYPSVTAYGKELDKRVPYLDIGTLEDKIEFTNRGCYEWIHLVLLVQAVFFYFPHGLWKSFEEGKIEQICETVASMHPVASANKDDGDSEQDESDFLYDAAIFLRKRFGYYNKYATVYFLCEIMAWLNVILQIYILDCFLQGEFISLGPKAVESFKNGTFDSDSLLWVFPRVAKCPFPRVIDALKFKNACNTETIDIFCILRVNALTEKIYIFIWFWFVSLFLFSFLDILLTIFSIALPKIRGFTFAINVTPVFSREADDIAVLAHTVGEQIQFGDCFVLTALSERLNALKFKKFLAYIHDELIFSKKYNV